jgi:UDP-N-acetylmuramoyl-L-alanyl-D-glutamate--2,6-diaminopimelate ligase
VFGCGGDRDKTKRSQMGGIADTLADHIIITNDNPRSESPEKIAQEILKGVSHQNKTTVELDRARAIQRAISSASPNDWVLIAGKGHETDQIVGTTISHHDDAECVASVLSKG